MLSSSNACAMQRTELRDHAVNTQLVRIIRAMRARRSAIAFESLHAAIQSTYCTVVQTVQTSVANRGLAVVAHWPRNWRARWLLSAMGSEIEIASRLVISHNKNQHWVPDTEDISMVGDAQFITLRHGDRGLAKFVGASLGTSNPLRQYAWLDTAKSARNDVVDKLLEALAAAQDPAFVPGGRYKRSKYEEHLPATVSVHLPLVEHGGESVGPMAMRAKAVPWCHQAFSVERTPENMAYVRVAMMASRVASTSDTPRKRPVHADRLCAITGVSGVFVKAKRLCTSYRDGDGKRRSKSVVNPGGNDTETLKAMSAKLLHEVRHMYGGDARDADIAEDGDGAEIAEDGDGAEIDEGDACSRVVDNPSDAAGSIELRSPNKRDGGHDGGESDVTESISNVASPPKALNAAWGHIFGNRSSGSKA